LAAAVLASRGRAVSGFGEAEELGGELAGGDAGAAGFPRDGDRGAPRAAVGPAEPDPCVTGPAGLDPVLAGATTTGAGVGRPSSSAGPTGNGPAAGINLLSRISPGGGAFTAVTSSVSFRRLIRSFVVGIFVGARYRLARALAPRSVPPFPPKVPIRIPSLTRLQREIRGGSAASAPRVSWVAARSF
jgi:hypothetical protein